MPRTKITAFLMVLALAAGCDAFSDNESTGGVIQSHQFVATLDNAALDANVLTATVAAPDAFVPAFRDKNSVGPSSVSVLSVELLPQLQSADNIAAWADLFVGEITVSLVTADGRIALSRVATPADGFANLSMSVIAGDGALDRFPAIAAGDFTVEISAGSPRDGSSTFKAFVSIVIEFLAT